jgi:hypothetical protein
MGPMGILVCITTGLCFWVVGWALGAKSFDAFMVTIALATLAATSYAFTPYLRRFLEGDR